MRKVDWSTLQGTCRFSDGQRSFEIDLTIPQSTDQITSDFKVTPCPLGHRATLTLSPKQAITIDTLMFTLACSEAKEASIFVNGYQSWTDSFEHSSTDRLPVLSLFAKWATRKYRVEAYSDSPWMKHPTGKGNFYGYTYAYLRWESTYRLIGSLSEDNGFTIVDVLVPKQTLRIRKDLQNIQITTPLTVEWVILEGERNPVFDAYFELQGISKPTQPVRSGWTSWYHYYQAVREPIILENLNAYSTHHPQPGVFQIDDGYQRAIGDWLTIDSTKFPNGMKPIANAIHKQGHLAGLWLAPFVAERNSALFRDHPQWFLNDSNGQPVCAGGNWSGAYALDLEHPDVRTYLTHVFDTVLNDWGYDLVKLDFLYAACMGHHPTKSRGQRMGEAMRFLRQVVGNKLILGCGVPLGSAFGRVDYCRIGPDVGLDWVGPWFHRYIHRERVSTQTAIRNAFGRSPLDHRAFLNDPDVFLLRDEGIQLSTHQRELLTRVNALTGSLLFTSDRVDVYDDVKKALFNTATACLPTRIETVDDQAGVITVHFVRNDQRRIAVINTTDHPVNHHDIPLQPFQLIEHLAKDPV